MSFFVKVIPPHKRARIHKADCMHCRNGQGQENQDKGTGPTYWSEPFPTLQEAQQYMELLEGYRDTGFCRDCLPNMQVH